MSNSTIDNQLPYAESHTSQPDKVLYDIYRSIWLHTSTPHQSSTPYQGTLLQLLATMKQPHLAVEVGSFMGYSTICLARGLAKGGILHAIEGNDELEIPLRDNISKAGVDGCTSLHIGDAKEIIPTLPNNIDLAFVDADKKSYVDYYRLLMPKLSSGALLIFDNVLWYGNVNSDRNDPDTEAIRQLNDLVTADPSLLNLLLPVRDGLMICIKL